MRALGVVALIIVGSTRLVGADNKSEADQLFIEGRALLEANPGEACAKFEKAQALQTDSIAIMLNLGVCKEKTQKLASALRWYQKTAAAANGSKDPNAKEYAQAANDAVAKLAPQVAKVTIKVSEPGVELFLAGARIEKNTPVELDAGDNTIDARKPGKITEHIKLTVKDGDAPIERDVPALRDAPKPPSAKNRKLAGVGIAVGSIAVASVIAGVWAHGIQKDVKSGETSKPDGTDQILKPTITFFAIAGVGTAVGAYFFFTKPKWKGESEAGISAVTPVVTPDSGGLAVLGRF